MTLSVTGDAGKVMALQLKLAKFGIVELVRTGKIALKRGQQLLEMGGWGDSALRRRRRQRQKQVRTGCMCETCAVDMPWYSSMLASCLWPTIAGAALSPAASSMGLEGEPSLHLQGGCTVNVQETWSCACQSFVGHHYRCCIFRCWRHGPSETQLPPPPWLHLCRRRMLLVRQHMQTERQTRGRAMCTWWTRRRGPACGR